MSIGSIGEDKSQAIWDVPDFVLETMTGIRFNPKYPEFDIEDIAHGLSNICRFGGQSQEFYSVAEHSIIVSHLTDGNPLEGLLHDASEAYLMDIPSPIKATLPDYKRLEGYIQKMLCQEYGIQYPFSEETHLADRQALVIESRFLTKSHGSFWIDRDKYAATLQERDFNFYRPVCMPPPQAAVAFIRRFHYLKEEQHAESSL